MMAMKNWMDMGEKNIMGTYKRFPIVLARGSGMSGKTDLVPAGNEWRFQIVLSARKGQHQAVITVWYAK